ncbi:MAG: hypothetical protein Q8O13_01025 [Candidatus Omnitrophota bacterium]|nr:hypothetical protein [Candidatus Omnitrophota bacterium]
MKSCILKITLILCLISNANILTQAANHKLEETKTQIHILNLLNGLELNKDQMQLILNTAKEAQNIYLKLKEEIAKKEEEINLTYQEVLRVAQAGSLIIPDNIASRVHKLNQEIDKIKENMQEKISTLAMKIRDCLAAHQLYALDEYKPCIIPPVKKGRIGQADDPAGFVKVLEKVHSMTEDRYNIKKDEIAHRAIDKLKAKVPSGFIIEQEKLKSQLLKAMDAVRVMSEVDFSLKKEEIAKNIKAQILPERPPLNIGVKIERFLLSPEIIPILEQRIASKYSS